MSNLSDIVDSLENKIGRLIENQKKLKQTCSNLELELARQKQARSETETELLQWKEQINTLKVANAMLGSDQFKRETKLKINSLIREIDVCIAQLSE